MSSIRSLARIGANSFHAVKCDESRMPDGFFYVKNDDAPEWVVELVKEAHGDMLPDDYKYKFVVGALEAITESDDDANIDDIDDNARSIVHDNVDIYTSRLFHWVRSHTDRLATANNFGKEFEAETIEAFLSGGQYFEIDEVFQTVLSTLANLAE